MIPEHRWLWRGRCIRVVDGDTIDVMIDSGFHATNTERLRLLGVDTPEIVGVSRAAGIAAKLFVAEWMVASPATDPWPLIIETHKTDAFGRYLANVWRLVDGGNLTEDIVAADHGVAV